LGVLLKKHIGKDCILGVWNVVESYDELILISDLTASDIEKLDSFSNLKRKLEWICTRILFKELTNSASEIIYNDDGKPFVADNSFKISISHSKSLVSVIVSKTREVGVDIEYVTNKIEKIVHKFLSIKEQHAISKSPERIIHLYICWSAKETLYKIFSSYKLNFIDNIDILPFIANNEGTINAIVSKDDMKIKCTLNYEIINNYVLICCFI
jgi:4'-phosphopantetheinyl transferase